MDKVDNIQNQMGNVSREMAILTQSRTTRNAGKESEGFSRSSVS